MGREAVAALPPSALPASSAANIVLQGRLIVRESAGPLSRRTDASRGPAVACANDGTASTTVPACANVCSNDCIRPGECQRSGPASLSPTINQRRSQNHEAAKFVSPSQAWATAPAA